MVIKTPNSGLYSLRDGHHRYGFQSSWSPCKVGTMGPILQMRKERLRRVFKGPLLGPWPLLTPKTYGLSTFNNCIQTFKC